MYSSLSSVRTNELCSEHLAETTLILTDDSHKKIAIDKAIEKIASQRELIDAQQLAGSNYMGRRDAVIPGTKSIKLPEALSEKAGKKLSAEYMKMLQDCVDDLKACLDTDKDMTRGTQAICERVVGKLGKMIESASESKPESDEAPPEKEASIITVKDAMAIFIANSNDADRSLMSAVLKTMDDIESKTRIAEQLRAFLNSK